MLTNNCASPRAFQGCQSRPERPPETRARTRKPNILASWNNHDGQLLAIVGLWVPSLDEEPVPRRSRNHHVGCLGSGEAYPPEAACPYGALT
eukprot:371412-Pyramimonas_sp.AAC.1